MLLRHTFETPVGPMVAVCSERALCALEFASDARLSGLTRRLSRWFDRERIVERASDDESPHGLVLNRVRDALTAYFDGTSAMWPGIELDPRGTEFEQRVWTALRSIPAGTTSSYGGVARAIGAPGAARAVGLANGANPLAIIVPCHRVIGADGSLTGYGGGLERKKWLLSHERRHWNALPLWLTDDFLSPASANVQPKGG